MLALVKVFFSGDAAGHEEHVGDETGDVPAVVPADTGRVGAVAPPAVIGDQIRSGTRVGYRSGHPLAENVVHDLTEGLGRRVVVEAASPRVHAEAVELLVPEQPRILPGKKRHLPCLWRLVADREF